MRKLAAKDVMSPGIEVVPQSMSVRELAGFLTEHEISGAPVADDNDELVGVVSLTDIARIAADGGPAVGERRTTFYLPDWEEIGSDNEFDDLHFEDDDLAVADIMSTTILSVDAEEPVSQVAESMLQGHVHRLLVTDESKVVGIVSTSDLLQVLVRGV